MQGLAALAELCHITSGFIDWVAKHSYPGYGAEGSVVEVGQEHADRNNGILNTVKAVVMMSGYSCET